MHAWTVNNTDVDEVNMKSAKKQKTAEEPQQDPVQVKAESEPEETLEVCVGEDGFNVQIKEEPHSQEIGEDRHGDQSDCKCGPVTSDWDVPQLEEPIKEEQSSIHVKEEEEEEELWLKEERDSGEEDQAPGRGEEEEEEEGTGRLMRLLHHLLKFARVRRVFLYSIFPISKNTKSRET